MNAPADIRAWPSDQLTRVPYWVYADAPLYAEEMERVFRGDTWSFLCMEAELPAPNTYRTSYLGDMLVVVTRDKDNAIQPFENRSARRGSLLCHKLLGGYSQILQSNWKLYIENVKDSYHASLLHMFFTTFRLNRLSQKGGLVVSEGGGNHISYSMSADVAGKEYEQAGMRTATEGYGALEAPELLKSV